MRKLKGVFCKIDCKMGVFCILKLYKALFLALKLGFTTLKSFIQNVSFD